MSTFANRVLRLVRRVPRGRVVSYGGVAAMLGAPRAARAVGAALRGLPDGSDVPWWRVVNGGGSISRRGAGVGARVQRLLLEAEGVRFDRRGRVDWSRFGWSPGWRARPQEAAGPKRSVALVIRDPRRADRFLHVRRPADDADLPLAWGLPAASLAPGETWTAAARRAAADKLGIRVGHLRRIAEGGIDRPTGALRMRLYLTEPAAGEVPAVPQPADEVTQYVAQRWGGLAGLRPAARKGSLCCRLALDAADRITP